MPLPTGLCEVWEPVWTCALPTGAFAVSGTALEMATETLYALSARRFGLCTLTIRPCRRDCFGDTWPFTGGQWWEFGGVSVGQYPRPALIGGLWYNLGCGGCAGECSCSIVHEVTLPGPVFAVTEVKVDGIVLVPEIDYRLDNHRLLVRLGGEAWPICNNLNEADTEVGTWSVTLQIGEPVPTLGQVAAGVLATEFTKMLLCDDSCALPRYVQSISRQGVDVTFIDPIEVFRNRQTGIYIADLFISTYNPNGVRQRARVYDIDAPYPRRTNT